MVKNQPANMGHRRRGFNPWIGRSPCKRAWQPAPVFLPGKSHGQRSLAGYRPWGHKESDMAEVTENTSEDALSPGCGGGCHTGSTTCLLGRIRHSFSAGVFAAVQLWHMDRRNTPGRARSAMAWKPQTSWQLNIS